MIAAGCISSSGSGEVSQETSAVGAAPLQPAALPPAVTAATVDAGAEGAAEVEAVCWDASLAAAPTAASAITAAPAAAFMLAAAASRVGAPAPVLTCRSLAINNSQQHSSPNVPCPLVPPAPVLASASPVRPAAQVRATPPASLSGARSNLQRPAPTKRFVSQCCAPAATPPFACTAGRGRRLLQAQPEQAAVSQVGAAVLSGVCWHSGCCCRLQSFLTAPSC